MHPRTGEGLVRGCACHTTEGFAHVSCLAEQAKILVAEGEENNLDYKAKNERWGRWHTCGLCEQEYHGVVNCALGWACWKTYVGRPEANNVRSDTMNLLGLSLTESGHHEDALSVGEALLSTMRRLGVPEDSEDLLIVKSNLSNTYYKVGRLEYALQMKRDVYSGRVKLSGEEHQDTLLAANNCASSLNTHGRFEEAKSLLRKTMPVARRVLGENSNLTLRIRWVYAQTLCNDGGATLDDLREAVTTLEEAERTARRVYGSAHPLAREIEGFLRKSQTALRAREESPGGA